MTRLGSRRRGNLSAEWSVLVVVVALAIVGDLWRRQRAPRDEVVVRQVEVVEDDPVEEPAEAPVDLSSFDGE